MQLNGFCQKDEGSQLNLYLFDMFLTINQQKGTKPLHQTAFKRSAIFKVLAAMLVIQLIQQCCSLVGS